VAPLASRQVGEALAALASGAEPPAAGVASALTCAVAAALVELTAGLAAERLAGQGAVDSSAEATTAARMRALAGRAAELRERLLLTADEDAHAYAKVTEAEDDAGRARALARASEPPLAIAECAAEVAEAAAEIAGAGAWAFRADAVVAGELAVGAALGASELVATNLAGRPGESLTARARAAADRAHRAGHATAGPAAD
jgi:formiminotetrahydrofolate cyclodeaminase